MFPKQMLNAIIKNVTLPNRIVSIRKCEDVLDVDDKL